MLKRVAVTLSFVFYLCGGGGGFGITTRWPSSLFPSFEMASGREATHFQELITEKSTPSSLSPTNRSFMDFLRASLSVAPFEQSVPFFPRKEGKGILHWEEKERGQGGGGVVFSLADQCHLAACEPKWITGEKELATPRFVYILYIREGFFFPFFPWLPCAAEWHVGRKGETQKHRPCENLCQDVEEKTRGMAPQVSSFLLPHTAGIGSAKSEAFSIVIKLTETCMIHHHHALTFPPPLRLSRSHLSSSFSSTSSFRFRSSCSTQ